MKKYNITTSKQPNFLTHDTHNFHEQQLFLSLVTNLYFNLVKYHQFHVIKYVPHILAILNDSLDIVICLP